MVRIFFNIDLQIDWHNLLLHLHCHDQLHIPFVFARNREQLRAKSVTRSGKCNLLEGKGKKSMMIDDIIQMLSI